MCDTQHLEGSCFVTRQPYRLAASGSRERLLASQLCDEGPKKCSTWLNSRLASHRRPQTHPRTRTTTSTRMIYGTAPLLAPASVPPTNQRGFLSRNLDAVAGFQGNIERGIGADLLGVDDHYLIRPHKAYFFLIGRRRKTAGRIDTG